MVQKKGAAEVASALAQLNAARTGAKRLDNFELKEEKDVYDVVDDEQYAQLVTKRRIEAGVVLDLTPSQAAHSTCTPCRVVAPPIMTCNLLQMPQQHTYLRITIAGPCLPQTDRHLLKLASCCPVLVSADRGLY